LIYEKLRRINLLSLIGASRNYLQNPSPYERGAKGNGGIHSHEDNANVNRERVNRG
jgi:hypothetical protein